MNAKQAAPEKPSSTEMTLDDALVYALQLQQEGRIEGAAQLYARILEKAPDHVDALHFLGVAKFQLGDGAAALDLIGRAIALKPDFASATTTWVTCSNACIASQKRPRRIAGSSSWIPENADAYNNLGALLRAQGKAAEAEDIPAPGAGTRALDTPMPSTIWVTYWSS